MRVQVVLTLSPTAPRFANAAANRLVLIEGGAAKVFNKPCSSSAAPHGRTMINELGVQHWWANPSEGDECGNDEYREE